jgi:hypothetical protein
MVFRPLDSTLSHIRARRIRPPDRNSQSLWIPTVGDSPVAPGCALLAGSAVGNGVIPRPLDFDSRRQFPRRRKYDSPWQTRGVCHGGRDWGSSTSLGPSCPSVFAIGRTGSNQRDLVLVGGSALLAVLFSKFFEAPPDFRPSLLERDLVGREDAGKDLPSNRL